MSARSLAAKARRAVKASARAHRQPSLPAGLQHLFQPYIPSQSQVRRRVAHIAPVVPIGGNLMHVIMEHQGFICPACDDWLEIDPQFGISHPLRPSFDHVMPRSRGGVSLANKLVMHRECNSTKGNRLPTGCERIWLMSVNARLGL